MTQAGNNNGNSNGNGNDNNDDNMTVYEPVYLDTGIDIDPVELKGWWETTPDNPGEGEYLSKLPSELTGDDDDDDDDDNN